MATTVSDTDRAVVDAAMQASSSAGGVFDDQIENAVSALLATNPDLHKKVANNPNAARDDALAIVESVMQASRGLSRTLDERHAERVASAVTALSQARIRTNGDVDALYHAAAEKLLETDERLKTLALKEGRVVAYGQALDLVSEALNEEASQAGAREHREYQLRRGTADYDRELTTLAAQRPDPNA